MYTYLPTYRPVFVAFVKTYWQHVHIGKEGRNSHHFNLKSGSAVRRIFKKKMSIKYK